MPEQKRSIVFRRIRGRIVPIRVKNSEALASGLGTAAAGVALAAVTGQAAGSLVRSAAHAENQARSIAKVYRNIKATARARGPLFELAAIKRARPIGEEALKAAVQSKLLYKASSGIKKFGNALAVGAIGYGAYQALKATNLKDNEQARSVIGAGAGAAAFFAIKSSFFKNLGSSKATTQAAKLLLRRKFGV